MPFSFIFFNSFGRLRSGWRASVFGALFLMLTAILLMFVNSAFEIFGVSSENILTPQIAFVTSSAIFLLAAILTGWICAKGIEGLTFRSLGWNLSGLWWRDLLVGAFFGAASLLLATGIAMLGGRLSLAFNQSVNINSIMQTVLISAVVFAFGAASEESLFRGYPLQTFARARLIWVGTVVSSLLFALVHSDNQNVTVFGLINTALAGIWFVIAYLKTRNLWFPFGLHWAWNWTMAAILGLPVSGITQITPEPVLRGIDQGPTWLTGGHYGIEGGAACTIALIVSSALIWFTPFLKPSAEMLALSSEENPKSPPTDRPSLLPPIFKA